MEKFTVEKRIQELIKEAAQADLASNGLDPTTFSKLHANCNKAEIFKGSERLVFGKELHMKKMKIP